METFKGAEVAPINEILERTHFVLALRAEIERLTNAGLEAAYGEATKADELEHWIATCDRLTAERDDLAGKLAEAHQELHDLRIRAGLGEGGERWEPVGSFSHDARYGLAWRRLTLDNDLLSLLTGEDCTSIVLPDDVRLCRRIEGQPVTGKGV